MNCVNTSFGHFFVNYAESEPGDNFRVVHSILLFLQLIVKDQGMHDRTNQVVRVRIYPTRQTGTDFGLHPNETAQPQDTWLPNAESVQVNLLAKDKSEKRRPRRC